MRSIGTALATVLALGLLLGGCAAMQREAAHRKENLLAAAGFRVKPADTPEKLANLQAMQPLKMIAHPAKDGTLTYTYADPEGCKCLWVGGTAQYAEYRRLAMQQQVAQAQADAAMANEEMAMDWGMWGPWGPW